jgi:hypothetical protein
MTLVALRAGINIKSFSAMMTALSLSGAVPAAGCSHLRFSDCGACNAAHIRSGDRLCPHHLRITAGGSLTLH